MCPFLLLLLQAITMPPLVFRHKVFMAHEQDSSKMCSWIHWSKFVFSTP